MRDPEFQARLAAAHNAPRGTPSGECPDPGELAALHEGQVAEGRRPELERHLTLCEPCLTALLALEADRGVGTVAGEHRVEAGGAAGRGRWMRRLVGVAAAALLAVGVYVFLRPRESETPPGDPIAMAVERVGALDRTLLAAVDDLTEPERAALARAPKRGTFEVLLPQGLVLDGRPGLRVAPVAGAGSYAVTVTDPLGVTVASFGIEGASAPWPASAAVLAPAREYVVRVEAQGAAGRARGVGSFRTAGKAEADAETAADATIERVAPGAIGALLRARRWIRLGAYESAERALEVAARDPATAREAGALAEVLARRVGRAAPR